MKRWNKKKQSGSDDWGRFPDAADSGFPNADGFSGTDGSFPNVGDFSGTDGSFPNVGDFSGTDGSFPNVGGFSGTDGGFPNVGDSAFPAPDRGGQSGYGIKYVTRLDRAGLIHAVAGGLVGAILAIVLYGPVLTRLAPADSHPALLNVLTIACVLALTGLCAQLSLGLHALFMPARLRLQRGWPWKLAAFTVALFALGALMQFLYGLGGVTVAEPPDDYIFLIDDSGSMAQTDPGRQRVQSMDVLMQKLTPDKRVAIAFFCDRIEYAMPLAPVTDDVRGRVRDAVNDLRNDGGTDIDMALKYALNMDGLDDERVTEIVLLTDGVSGGIEVKRLAEACRNANARISAIVMDSGLGNRQVRKLTRMTGGTLYEVNRLDDLTDAYANVGIATYNRNLLGLRSYLDHDSFPLGLLRVFSWLLFGAAVGLGMLLLLDAKDQLPLLIPGPVFGLALGILLEVLNGLWLDGAIMGMNSKALLVPVLCVAVLYYRAAIRTAGGQVSPAQTGGQTDDKTSKSELGSNENEDDTRILGKW